MMVTDDAPAGIPDAPLATPRSAALEFTLLGQLQVLQDGVDHAPTAPKVLQVVALLLVHPGAVVSTAEIVEELWGERPPRSVRATVQTYIWQLRRCLTGLGVTDADEVLVTRPPGYVLHVDRHQLDIARFQQLRDAGRAQLVAGDHGGAAETLRRAAATYAGRPLANVDCGPVLSQHVFDLEEQLRETRLLRIEAELAAGAHRSVLGELHMLTRANPLDEMLRRQLIRALARSGRRSDAMSTYHDLRTRLVAEYGVEPDADTRRLYLSLLDDVAVTDAAAPGVARPGAAERSATGRAAA